MALCLTNLRALDLRYCGLKTQAAFPVLATLPKLQEWVLYGNDVTVDDVGLLRFVASTSLTKLGIPEGSSVTDEAEQRVRAPMPW